MFLNSRIEKIFCDQKFIKFFLPYFYILSYSFSLRPLSIIIYLCWFGNYMSMNIVLGLLVTLDTFFILELFWFDFPEFRNHNRQMLFLIWHYSQGKHSNFIDKLRVSFWLFLFWFFRVFWCSALNNPFWSWLQSL